MSYVEIFFYNSYFISIDISYVYTQIKTDNVYYILRCKVYIFLNWNVGKQFRTNDIIFKNNNTCNIVSTI